VDTEQLRDLCAGRLVSLLIWSPERGGCTGLGPGHWHHVALTRRILPRMRSCQNYIFMEDIEPTSQRMHSAKLQRSRSCHHHRNDGYKRGRQCNNVYDHDSAPRLGRRQAIFRTRQVTISCEEISWWRRALSGNMLELPTLGPPACVSEQSGRHQGGRHRVTAPPKSQSSDQHSRCLTHCCCVARYGQETR
jgi:hypothetical protein